MLLTREQALNAKRVTVTVAFPELGGDLKLGAVMASTSTKVQELNATAEKDKVRDAFVLLMLEESILDENDAKLFDAEGAAAFHARLSSETLERLLTSIPGFTPKAKGGPGVVPSETAPVVSSPSV